MRRPRFVYSAPCYIAVLVNIKNPGPFLVRPATQIQYKFYLISVRSDQMNQMTSDQLDKNIWLQ